MTAARPQPTREDLQRALHASGCSISLDEALKSPALALALRNTAAALSDRPRAPRRIDVRRLAANDDTETEP